MSLGPRPTIESLNRELYRADDRIAALEAAMLRLLEAGAGMATLVSIDWRERKAWDEAASAAKGLAGK